MFIYEIGTLESGASCTSKLLFYALHRLLFISLLLQNSPIKMRSQLKWFSIFLLKINSFSHLHSMRFPNFFKILLAYRVKIGMLHKTPALTPEWGRGFTSPPSAVFRYNGPAESKISTWPMYLEPAAFADCTKPRTSYDTGSSSFRWLIQTWIRATVTHNKAIGFVVIYLESHRVVAVLIILAKRIRI